MESDKDLMQECLTHWYFKREQYDPSQPATCKTFMNRVIEHKLMDIIKEKGRQKRKVSYQTISLDALTSDFDSNGGYEELLIEDENIAEFLRSDIEEAILNALQKLSFRQRELCRLVKDEGLSMRQVSKRMSIPRATLSDEILRIRQTFKQEGLNHYL